MSLHIIAHVVTYLRSIMHMHFYCYVTGGSAYLLDRGKEWCHSGIVSLHLPQIYHQRMDQTIHNRILSTIFTFHSLVQALPPWVYEPICSLGFSLLVVTRPHTDTDPMRWLFLKWIHNPENFVLWNGHLMAWSCPGMALTIIGPNLGNTSTHSQPRPGTRLHVFTCRGTGVNTQWHVCIPLSTEELSNGIWHAYIYVKQGLSYTVGNLLISALCLIQYSLCLNTWEIKSLPNALDLWSNIIAMELPSMYGRVVAIGSNISTMY